VLRGASAQAEKAELKNLIDEQTGRIDQIVSYQRQRAAVAGVSSVTRPVDLAPILQRLCNGLDKVHSRRAMHCELTIPDEVRIRADEGDLFELFGNLLENAYKHATRNIQVDVRQEPQQLTVCIDDDGPGVAADDVERILKRGERADQRNAGEGIGLAVVSEIVAQYSGHLTVGRSALGGATFQVTLPR
jgi:two-component system sensor histidine kinase PhoQ